MLLFFTHDFGLIDIEHTAIIVALGIDRGDDEKYEISAQIAVPQASTSSSSNSESIISAKGSTIGEAIDKIAVNTGWYPLFAFCNLIILGESSLNGNVMDVINFFIRSDRIPDSASLCACEGTAKKLLLSNTPLDSVTSFALLKILEQDYAKLDRIANINVKNFVSEYFSPSSRGFIPLVKKVKSGDSKNASEGGSGNSESGGSGGENPGDESDVYDASSAVFFSHGKPVEILTPEETLLFNLRDKNSIDTFIKLENAEVDGQKTDLLIEIDETEKKYGFKFDNGLPVYEIKMNVQCRIVSANAVSPVSELFPAAEVPDEILLATEKKITETLEKLYRKLQISDCDLFGIKNVLYKFHYDKYEKMKDDVLKSTVLKTDVVCKSKSTTRV